ncbi:hypothetical protein V9T40_007002 [Parthenolecanium corni]|uniref:Sushi domain-containing protein n=1 Tax=Parthenolecanium corni TaxID=536013 RepID=A0AAN9U331_9HEMI
MSSVSISDNPQRSQSSHGHAYSFIDIWGRWISLCKWRIHNVVPEPGFVQIHRSNVVNIFENYANGIRTTVSPTAVSPTAVSPDVNQRTCLFGDDKKVYHHSTQITQTCNEGYRSLTGNNNTAHVCHNGEWYPPIPKCYNCGRPEVRQDLILRAEPEKPTGSPWHVAIYDISGKEPGLICGGTIIGAQMIVSAAHCFIKVQTKSIEDPKKYEISGWGVTESGKPSPILMTTFLPFINLKNCLTMVNKEFANFIAADAFCAGIKNS